VIEQPPELQKLQEELIERFGAVTFARAWHMSSLRNCLQALAHDELTSEERKLAHAAAGLHLAQMQATFITLEQSGALTECAARIDSAIDMWALDELERRDGLPAA
jgi:hypothetical protein